MRSRHTGPHADTQGVLEYQFPSPASTIRHITLNYLSFPKGGRRKISAESIQKLAERIHLSCRLQSLMVVADEDSQYYCVVAGERRFAALQLLVKQRRISPTFLVPCRVINARATSQANPLPEIDSAANTLETTERRRRFVDLLSLCPGLLTGAELAARQCCT